MVLSKVTIRLLYSLLNCEYLGEQKLQDRGAHLLHTQRLSLLFLSYVFLTLLAVDGHAY